VTRAGLFQTYDGAETPATATTDPAGTARHAAFTLDGYFTLNTSLTRRLVQLDNGALVVMDTVRPGAKAAGRSAGPVWQIPCATAPDTISAGGATGVGAVFDARGFVNSLTRVRDDDARLLVVMEAAPGRDYGSVRPAPALWAGANPLATYARSTLQAGKPAAFLTIFVPHEGDAAALAAGIRILRTGPDAAEIHLDGATAEVPTTRVALHADGTWAVDEIARPAPATVTLAGLFQTYDGTEKPATATTDPAGLPLLITYDGATAAPVAVGDYDVIAQVTDPAYYGRATGTLTLVMPYPIILEQPRSTVAPAGGAASFTVGVTGAEPMSFQWEKSTDAGANYAPVTGGTAATLTLPAVTPDDAGALYRVTITNQHSPPAAVSEPARLEVTAAPFPPPAPDGAAAAGVTGGGDAAPVLVASEAALLAALAAPGPAVIVVQGAIAAAAPLTLSSGKTLQGLDATAAITGGLVAPAGAENIILRGLTLANPAGAGPALAINDARDLFIEHCTFADSAAGLVTITGAAAGITIAWSEFYYSEDYIAANPAAPRAAITIAGSGAPAAGATAGITLHDNLLGPGCLAALPAVSGARVHLYNNLIAVAADAAGATTAGPGAELFAENNRYAIADGDGTDGDNPDGAATALEKTDDTAAILARGNAYAAVAPGAPAADHVFTPDYAYALVPAAALAATRMDAAGNTAGAASTHAPAPAGALAITGPALDTVPLETAFTLAATPENCAPAAWQWRRGNLNLAGATAATHSIASATPAHSGFYTVEAALSGGGSLVSRPWLVAVGIPLILAQPAALTVPSARAASFRVEVRGNGLAYQWFKNGEPIAGATAATLNFANAKLTDAGAYHVVVSNDIGAVASATATLAVETLTLPSAGSGGGGGGGASTPWLAALLAALLLARAARRR
jgi:pectate lyase